MAFRIREVLIQIEAKTRLDEQIAKLDAAISRCGSVGIGGDGNCSLHRRKLAQKKAPANACWPGRVLANSAA